MGNVLAVVTDKIKGNCQGDSISYFSAEVLYAYDYSPFGAILPGRHHVADSNCRMVDDYDTVPGTTTNFTVFFEVSMNPGDDIIITNGTTNYTLASYTGPFSNDFYAAQVASNAPGIMGSGVAATSFGAFVNINLDIPAAGYSCGDVIEVYRYQPGVFKYYNLP